MNTTESEKLERLLTDANKRLMWDGIWEETVRRVPLLDGALYTTFDEACRMVGDPKLVLCPWSIAQQLLIDNDNAFMKSKDGLLGDYPFKRDTAAEQLGDAGFLWKGYVGRYRGASIIATPYLGIWENYCIVSSAADPLKIEYDGSNCVMVTLP